VVAVLIGRCAPAGDLRCSRKGLLDTQGSWRAQQTFARRARHETRYEGQYRRRDPVARTGEQVVDLLRSSGGTLPSKALRDQRTATGRSVSDRSGLRPLRT